MIRGKIQYLTFQIRNDLYVALSSSLHWRYLQNEKIPDGFPDCFNSVLFIITAIYQWPYPYILAINSKMSFSWENFKRVGSPFFGPEICRASRIIRGLKLTPIRAGTKTRTHLSRQWFLKVKYSFLNENVLADFQQNSEHYK